MTDDSLQHDYWEQEHGHREYNHPVVSAFARQRIAYIQQWLNLDNIQTALDVGCGNGFSTYYLSSYIPHILGVDRSQAMLNRHPAKQEKNLAIADGFQLPFRDSGFDLVYGWEIVHHISDPGIVVLEMARVSQRYVLLAEPNRNNPAQFAFALWDKEHRWVLRYSLGYMRQMFQSAGLKVVHAGCGGWLFPNVTPPWLLSLILKLPYRFPLGISNWVLGEKA